MVSTDKLQLKCPDSLGNWIRAEEHETITKLVDKPKPHIDSKLQRFQYMIEKNSK